MKILHLCLSCFYIDGYNYQENVLPRLHLADGNEVLVIASTETYTDNMKLGYVEPSEYVGDDGVHVIRLPYRNIVSSYVSTKIRKYKGLTEELEKFAPDVIFSHDLSYLSVKEVIRYLKDHPDVRFFADTHTAAYNSGMNWVSLNILHKIFYKNLIRQALPYLEKYFYIGENEKLFSLDVYKVPESITEFYPLGGIIPDENTYLANRTEIRRALGVSDDELLFLHSGKLTPEKKTLPLVRAFMQSKELRARLAIVGSVGEEIKDELSSYASEDPRIMLLGWKSADELMKYLCACDLYCQPGSVSATLQNAVCSFAPVMTYPHLIYQKIDNGNFVWVENEADMSDFFEKLGRGDIDYQALKEKTCECAVKYLDYKKLAARIY